MAKKEKKVKIEKIKLSPEENRAKNFKYNELTLRKYGLAYNKDKASITFIYDRISYRIGMNVGRILMYDEELKKTQVGANIWEFIQHHKLKPLELPNDVFSFGKYFGRRIEDIMKEDNQYVLWVCKNNVQFNEKIKDIIKNK